MKTEQKITVVIKAKNEEKQIGEAIKNALELADNVLVVDDQSTDRTAEIARALGAKVVRGVKHDGLIDKLDYQGFMEVTDQWILRMDADERLTPGLVEQLKSLSHLEELSGVKYARKYFMFGDFVEHGGWLKANTVGFFRSNQWDKNWTCELHSQVPVLGNIEVIDASKGVMLHYDYENIGTFVNRSLGKYSRVEAMMKVSKGSKFSILRLFWKPFRKFFGRFFLRHGFRDGKRGLIVALLLALYDMMIEIYIWEIVQEPKREKNKRSI